MKLMDSFKIFTNNPLVQAKHPEAAVFLEGGAESLLYSVRDKVHLGAVILSHPLSGGVLPGRTPYKSLILSDMADIGQPRTDFDSLNLIENALMALKKTPVGFVSYDEKTLEDFQVLDLDLVDSALDSITNIY